MQVSTFHDRIGEAIAVSEARMKKRRPSHEGRRFPLLQSILPAAG